MQRLLTPTIIEQPYANAGKLLFGWYDDGEPAIEGDYSYIGPNLETPQASWAYVMGERE